MPQIKSVDTSLDRTNIRYCSYTVEHPFDTDFAPAQANSDWVKLVDSEDDEDVLLLCPYSEDQWVAWVPSKGEAILHINQLCRIPT